MKRRHQPGDIVSNGRHMAGRAQDDDVVDTYKLAGPPGDPSACPDCGAVYRDGRWQWLDRPESAGDAVCPACHRARDGYPAGIVTLSGPLTGARYSEMTSLIHHQEEAEKGQHPLRRVIDVRRDGEGLFVRTTDIHLPHRIGQAVQRAFHGRLKVSHDRSNYFIRVEWEPLTPTGPLRPAP